MLYKKLSHNRFFSAYKVTIYYCNKVQNNINKTLIYLDTTPAI